jgi:hypothetical protein
MPSSPTGGGLTLMLGWGRSTLLLIGSRWIVALRDALLNRLVRITARSSKSRPRH